MQAMQILKVNKEKKEMKRISRIFATLMVLMIVLTAVGCAKKDENSLTGTWEYTDKENDIGAVYVFNNDSTGTYTMKVAGQEVTYEMKYEVNDNHLLVTYVNNEIFSEDDVFDSEFSWKDSDTLIIKDTFGTEMEFVRQ